MRTKFLYIAFLFLMLIPFDGSGQCAMCRAALETGGDNSQAEAVNDGIVYLMVIPYILVAVIGYWVYKVNKK